jgi:hypothetical protein
MGTTGLEKGNNVPDLLEMQPDPELHDGTKVPFTPAFLPHLNSVIQTSRKDFKFVKASCLY